MRKDMRPVVKAQLQRRIDVVKRARAAVTATSGVSAMVRSLIAAGTRDKWEDGWYDSGVWTLGTTKYRGLLIQTNPTKSVLIIAPDTLFENEDIRGISSIKPNWWQVYGMHAARWP